ncbi:hypothetical protein QBC36DRAFT_189943 [Triangularia setosa]|uniref:TauD/TfdA-like domain-containing protein n=1 Tax=Triangularia setosa TaxID=2587417 RepID=A0AAN6W4U1_9PEZI|nr:hypothetical protein QBC36DRAFT_189943 [Podospora setosa]
MATVEILRPAHYEPSVDLPAPYPPCFQFPYSLTRTDQDSSIDDVVSEIKNLTASSEIRSLLNQHGAVYFQNLNLKSADEFSQFAHAFGFVPHEDIGNPVRRTILAPNVATANEGPNTMPVFPHNEFGLSPHFPSYVFFYCAEAPETGGETPLNPSTPLLHHLTTHHPEFISRLRQLGLKYQLFHPSGPRSQTSSPGTTVLQAYGQHVLDSDPVDVARAKIETEIRRLPTAKWEWVNISPENELGDLRVWQLLPGIRTHPHTGEEVFFNNCVSRFLNAAREGTLEAPYKNEAGEFLPPCFVSFSLLRVPFLKTHDIRWLDASGWVRSVLTEKMNSTVTGVRYRASILTRRWGLFTRAGRW